MNYFYRNGVYIHPINRTAMGTKLAVVKSINLPVINLQIVENNLVFDICYKPTNPFNYLTYTSCHSTNTKNNILLSLAKHFVSIVTNNTRKLVEGIQRTFI